LRREVLCTPALKEVIKAKRATCHMPSATMQARSMGFPLAISGEVLSHAGLLPVNDEGLAVQAEAGEEEPILAVAVGGLV
jgi:hypothetical protein